MTKSPQHTIKPASKPAKAQAAPPPIILPQEARTYKQVRDAITRSPHMTFYAHCVEAVHYARLDGKQYRVLEDPVLVGLANSHLSTTQERNTSNMLDKLSVFEVDGQNMAFAANSTEFSVAPTTLTPGVWAYYAENKTTVHCAHIGDRFDTSKTLFSLIDNYLTPALREFVPLTYTDGTPYDPKHGFKRSEKDISTKPDKAHETVGMLFISADSNGVVRDATPNAILHMGNLTVHMLQHQEHAVTVYLHPNHRLIQKGESDPPFIYHVAAYAWPALHRVTLAGFVDHNRIKNIRLPKIAYARQSA